MRRLQIANKDALRKALRVERGRSAGTRLLHRLHCVFLVAAGCSCYEVGGWFGEDRKTIERWIHAWNQTGIEGLAEHRHGGRRPVLDGAQMATLRVDLCASPRAVHIALGSWSGRALQEHLERRFGVHLGLRQCQRLLRTMRPALPAERGARS